MLAAVLSRAVPDVQVKSAEIVKSSARAVCWIRVSPNHDRYWRRFKEVYPYYRHLALKHGAERFTLGHCCPKFPTREDLLDWVVDVLNLTQGERDFLRLCRGVK